MTCFSAASVSFLRNILIVSYAVLGFSDHCVTLFLLDPGELQMSEPLDIITEYALGLLCVCLCWPLPPAFELPFPPSRVFLPLS